MACQHYPSGDAPDWFLTHMLMNHSECSACICRREPRPMVAAQERTQRCWPSQNLRQARIQHPFYGVTPISGHCIAQERGQRDAFVFRKIDLPGSDRLLSYAGAPVGSERRNFQPRNRGLGAHPGLGFLPSLSADRTRVEQL